MITLNNLTRMCIGFLGCIYISQSAHAQSNLTLHDTLNGALEKQSNLLTKPANQPNKTEGLTSWIDGVPSVSLMRLESNDILGTSESELSFNFAIKSSFLKAVEKQLDSKIADMKNSAQEQYKLFLSGLIRDLLWELEFQKSSLNATTKKNKLLSKLALQYHEMAQANAIPLYFSLIVHNEINQLALVTMQHERKIANLKEQYFRITGLRIFPEEIKESLLTSQQMNMHLHPDIRALDLAYESNKQQLNSDGKKASAWNVQIIGKHLSTANFSENQLGLGIEIPIGVGPNLSKAQQSEFLRLTIEYEISREKRISQLTETHIALLQEYEFLQQKQVLLNNSQNTLNSLTQSMNELREFNAPKQEFYIRTLLSTIDAEYQLEANLLSIHHQIALIRQAAGISL